MFRFEALSANRAGGGGRYSKHEVKAAIPTHSLVTTKKEGDCGNQRTRDVISDADADTGTKTLQIEELLLLPR